MADYELVQMIKSGGGKGAKLYDADLRDADLGDVNLSGAKLVGADLTGAYLTNANFYRANLKNAILMSADLQGADFRDTDFDSANLQGADFRNADLKDAYFHGADLYAANFKGARLQGANLQGADLTLADLRDADLTDADLTGADLQSVKYDPQTIWPKGFTPPGEGRMASYTRISASSEVSRKKKLVNQIKTGDFGSPSLTVRNINFSSENLSRVDLSGSSLSGATCKGVNFTGSVLRKMNLSRTALQEAKLKNADLSGSNLADANLAYADLSNSDLTNANLSGTSLKGAILTGAIFDGVKYDAQTIWPRGFTLPGESRMASYTRSAAAKSNSKMTKIVEMIMSGEGAGADLRKVKLQGADLKGANLRRTDFRDANLQGADLEGANLRNVLLEGANLQVANLTKANLSGSDLSRVKFKDVELRNADLRGAYLNDANFYGSDLNKANLSGANLSGANFKLSDLRGAILDDIKYDDKTKWPAKFKPPAESRMASRRSRRASMDESNMISAFTFSIPLVWETYGGELMEDSPAAKGKRRAPSEYMFTGEESDYAVPVSYEIPKTGKMSIQVTDSIPAEYLPPKQKVNHEETDDMLLWEVNTHRELVRPDDVTSGVYVNGYDVDDRKGEHIALLNRRTGMVMVMLMDGLQRIATKSNLYPSKITGSGFMVPKDAFRLIYKGIPELTLEQLPEVLEAVLTRVEVADDDDSVDYRDEMPDDFPY